MDGGCHIPTVRSIIQHSTSRLWCIKRVGFGSDPLRSIRIGTASSVRALHLESPSVSFVPDSPDRPPPARNEGEAEGMKDRGSYVPPMYIPLQQGDDEADSGLVDDGQSTPPRASQEPQQWSSGICACCDDMTSCCLGTFCPCFLFGKNAEFLGSGTLAGSCMTHFILLGLVNSLCCMFTGGIILGIPGAAVACYTCGYRRALRAKYNLQEAPCGDLTTHLCCHLCAICQEYREIRERSDGSSPVLKLPAAVAPPVQTMESMPRNKSPPSNES